MNPDQEIVLDTDNSMSLFRPPILRSASAILDRALFSKIIPITAARVHNLKHIGKYRDAFGATKELLVKERLRNVREDPEKSIADRGGKCMLLCPEVKALDSSTWSSVLKEAVEVKEISVIDYTLELGYDYWTYSDIMESLLPADKQGEIPVGFAVVGHVAHLNIRDEYLPYKQTIAAVIVDKNPSIKTIINKIDDVGEHSEFRTFKYEVLFGKDDLNVEHSEGGCMFRFDWSKVYWNSRLQTEHKRLIDLFEPGEVVCDVMAGIGPFAVPAGKKQVFVWANDLNPDSFSSMKDAVTRNKVEHYVRPFCQDGHKFIQYAADNLLELTATGNNIIEIPGKPLKRNETEAGQKPSVTIVTIPQTINHFVMNLPATAIEFLGSFNGLYNGHEQLFEPFTNNKLPVVHVHCFSTKSADNVQEHIDICQRITEVLGYEIRPDDADLVITDVRDVAPKKRMFCASFRLPREVAFGCRREI